MKLSKLWSKLIISALGVIEKYLINQVKNPTLKAAMQLQIQPLKATTLALSDENPLDDEQLAAIWKEHLGTNVTVFAESEIGKLLEKIKDENLKKVLALLSLPVVNSLRLVTDENVHDGEQLEAEIRRFLADETSQRTLVENVLIPYVLVNIKEDGIREFVTAILKELLNGGTLGD